MRVGILTFHRAVNYGAALQAYALYRVLSEQGYETEIIDYRCEKVEESVSPLAGFRQEPKKIVRNITQFVFRTIKGRSFKKFYKKYVRTSNAVRTEKELNMLNDRYDCFIAGSDQIWNWGCSGSDKAYFLDFVSDDKKKNSYAASFGFEKKMQKDPFNYNELLSTFHGISMRERSGADIVYGETGRQGEVHVDPTLLLTKEQWVPILSKRPIKQSYIFVYYIREPYNLLKYAEILAEKTGCKIINAKKSIEFLKKCSPQDFLNWIYYADYIVTNSFHGTVFSIIFEKKFAVEIDNGKSKNNRSEELLELVKLSEHSLDIANMEQISKESDYNIAKEILKKEKNKAIQYLNEIMVR